MEQLMRRLMLASGALIACAALAALPNAILAQGTCDPPCDECMDTGEKCIALDECSDPNTCAYDWGTECSGECDPELPGT